MRQILVARLFYAVQEHECMCAVDPDPDQSWIEPNTELSCLQRFSKISGFKRSVGKITEGCCVDRIGCVHRLFCFRSFPCVGAIRIFSHLDAPVRWPRAKEKHLALFDRKTTGHNRFGIINGRLAGLEGGELVRCRRSTQECDVPHPCGVVRTANDDVCPIRRHRHARNAAARSQLKQLCPGFRVPYTGVPWPRGAASRASDNAGSIRRYGHGVNADMWLELDQLSAAACVPYPCGPVGRPSDDAGAVCRDRYAPDRAGMAFKLQQL